MKEEEIKTVTKEDYIKINSSYSCVQRLSGYQERLSTIFTMGLYICPLYEIEKAEKLDAKIYQQNNLPAFTLYNSKDASYFNWARVNLFSLLIPIHDRGTALEEFRNTAKKWALKTP